MDQSHHELAIIGQVGGRRPAQDFVHKDGRALAQLTEVPSNGQQAPRLGKVPPVQHGQEPVPERQGQKLLPVGAKEGCIHDQERVSSLVDHGCKGRLKGRGSARLHPLELHAQRPRSQLEVVEYLLIEWIGRIDQDCHP
jgi:hypothetical protein